MPRLRRFAPVSEDDEDDDIVTDNEDEIITDTEEEELDDSDDEDYVDSDEDDENYNVGLYEHRMDHVRDDRQLQEVFKVVQRQNTGRRTRRTQRDEDYLLDDLIEAYDTWRSKLDKRQSRIHRDSLRGRRSEIDVDEEQEISRARRRMISAYNKWKISQ